MITTNSKIEIRPLNRDELAQLIAEAPEVETNNLLGMAARLDEEPYDFMMRYNIELTGMIEDGRPVYIAALMKNDDGEYEFWTVANRNIKNMLSMCKYAKRILDGWLFDYKLIYATMPKGNKRNHVWVEWLGFNKIAEDRDSITYLLQGDIHGVRG